MKKFIDRHAGPNAVQQREMLNAIGEKTIDDLIVKTIPHSIRTSGDLDVAPAISEHQYLEKVQKIALENEHYRSYIGMGYYGTLTPPVILRNLFQNPGWYTQYTPYQAEISQGRLESLLNFQTLVCDLTQFPISNASLLDEATAAAEAMSMFFSLGNRKKSSNRNVIMCDAQIFPQTLEVMRTRAQPLGIEVRVDNWHSFDIGPEIFAVMVQYPTMEGAVEDYRQLVSKVHEMGGYVIVACDLLALTLLAPPGEWGADAAVGNTQRFGVPMGYGGPHAAFFATREAFKRHIPGRIIGVSVDAAGNQALRMALQTREQHIRREKATSNICTAQALLANMCAMYAVYHGPDGLRDIADEISRKAHSVGEALVKSGYELRHETYFDTISLKATEDQIRQIKGRAEEKKINLWYTEDRIQFSIDETVSTQDLEDLAWIFSIEELSVAERNVPEWAGRKSVYLTHPVFHTHQSETKLMRYLKSLENKDLSLVHSMIPLGSCTMKLNAAAQMIPVSLDSFSDIHPYVPDGQVKGYNRIIEELASDLCKITGFDACSFQPNSGAQGEFAGLIVIKKYHESRGDRRRDVALIPSSAHGTNPASAVMAGMKVIIVACDDNGNISVEDLKKKAIEHSENLCALMVTYPSTHGVFESLIVEICDIVHQNGGMVYMDGANMNAQVGLTNPAQIGADVCHLNLHKTFAIPHGGGGPGMGPICANAKLAPHLPGHLFDQTTVEQASGAVSAAPFGSASILLISYAYIKMLGGSGLTTATKLAILNANYLKARLSDRYAILYVGENGYAAHEFILDLRPFKAIGIGAEDVAKRLIDFGFHAPTLSFPVPGTLMIEPTESEDKEELDRFCDAMLLIKEEIDEVARGEYPNDNNVLVNAPHTASMICSDDWPYPYTRQKAAYPASYLTESKFWPSVRRVNNAHGDRTLICTCPPTAVYQETPVK